MAKGGLETTMGVLEMKLGFCLTAPTKRAIKDLHDIGAACNVVRNGIVRHWERWREDNPNWKPEQRRNRKGEAKVARKMAVEKPYKVKQVKTMLENKQARENAQGEVIFENKVIAKYADAPVLENPAASQDLENEMYHVGCKLAPEIGCSIVASLRGEVLDRLKSRLPYNHPGKSQYRYEGIINYECSRDCYRAIAIPAPNSITIVGYDGNLSRDLSKNVTERLKKLASSNCIVRLQLFSQKSGRENLDHVFWIESRQLPRGKKAILRRITTGEWKLCDSKLVYKRDGWYYQLTYKQPQKSLNLDKKNVATLLMNPSTASQPLSIRFTTDTGKVISWQLGDAEVLRAELNRLEMRRKVIQNRYKTAGPGRKGHGRQRAYKPMRPLTRKLNDLQEVFTNYLVASVLKFCARFNCGSLVYREPGMFLRTLSWFEKRGNMSYNWTSLVNKLKHKTWLNGIDIEVRRMSYKNHKEIFPQVKELTAKEAELATKEETTDVVPINA